MKDKKIKVFLMVVVKSAQKRLVITINMIKTINLIGLI